MTAQNNLEIKGNLSSHPFAELLLESSEANLTGSFRLSSESNKVIVYLNNGKVVFAVSNARRHRLFEILLRERRIAQAQLAGVANLANDLELSANLKSRNILSETQAAAFFSAQIEEILQFVLNWSDGEWIFSSQTRIKEGIRFEANTPRLILEYARNLPEEMPAARLKNERESFGAKPSVPPNTNLFPAEAFVLSRFEKSFLTISDIKNLSGLPEQAVSKILYVLWLGGFLFRQNWQAAFSKRQVAELLSAKLSLKKESSETQNPLEEKPVEAPIIQAQKATATEPSKAEEIPKKEEILLEDYLEKSENAANHYEVLDVARDADAKEIKARYFAFAKQFHPDMFYQEKDSVLLQRIQAAFARTAQAYETLKNEETRKVYDYKLDKNLVLQKPKSSDAAPKNLNEQETEIARESFEMGFSLLMDDEPADAVPFLARAAQLAPNNAKYRAYYGKSLSLDENQRHKADAELQAAIRLEPKNETYRLVSAEFYMQYGLAKRAEGELKRLLEMSPNHPEALRLLDQLQTK